MLALRKAEREGIVKIRLDLPEDRVLSTDPPTTVTVRLRGAQTSLRRLDALRLAVSVDLRDGVVGELGAAAS